MPLCEGCPRANDRYKKGIEQEIEEVRETGGPIRAQLADTALALLELGSCVGRKEVSIDNADDEFGDNGYFQCQHTTEAAAKTIISQGTHALDRLARKTV
ncbi:MAG: hypothetical protein AAB395_03145 [Patescibacteria group bacterium]